MDDRPGGLAWPETPSQRNACTRLEAGKSEDTSSASLSSPTSTTLSLASVLLAVSLTHPLILP